MAYAFVTSVINSSNANTVTIAPTAGNFVVLFSATSSGGGNPTATVSGSTSGSWTQAKAVFNDGIAVFHSVFYKENHPGGSETVTVTYNGGTPGSCGLITTEYSGIATSSSLIATVVAYNVQTNPGTATNAITSNTQNVSIGGATGALILGYTLDPTQLAISPGTGYTQRASSNISGYKALIEDLRATSSGNQTATFTSANGATHSYISIVLAFSEPAGLTPVQKTTAVTSIGPNSFNVTLSGVAAGNLLTLQMSFYTGASGANSVAIATPTDTNGTWYLATSYSGNNSGGTGAVTSAVAYCRSANSGTHTVTVQTTGGYSIGSGYATMAEWSGASFGANTNVDQTAFANATTAQTNTSGTTGVTLAASELALVVITEKSGAGVASIAISDPPAGYTSMYVNNVTNAGAAGVEHAYKVTGVSGTQSASWSWTDATTALSQGVIAVLSNTPTPTWVFYRPAAQFVDESVIQL